MLHMKTAGDSTMAYLKRVSFSFLLKAKVLLKPQEPTGRH